MTCGGLPGSPAPAPMPAVAAPLEDENLLPEILVRLAPLPSALPRASLVCKRWRRLVTDRRFVRRFRAHHLGGPPPLIGFFEEVTRKPDPHNPAPGDPNVLSFTPILDHPDRVPVGRFSLHLHDGHGRSNIGCRDGLVLLIYPAGFDIEVLVWDPVTGDQHRFLIPWVIDDGQGTEILNGAVLRTAGILDDRPFRFQAVLTGVDGQNKRLFACVYSSETGKWGDPIWVSADFTSGVTTMIEMRVSSTMVGNSLYWSLCSIGWEVAAILQFDLDTQHLAVIHLPCLGKCSRNGSRTFRAVPVDGGELGVLELFDANLQLWKRKIDRDGVVSWVLEKTIGLEELLYIDKRKMGPMMLGYCEDNNVVFIWTYHGIFMVQLESLEVYKPPIQTFYCLVHPFTSVYTADMGIGGEPDEDKLLCNAMHKVTL
ncbi:hypothetical protein CFC21_079794 [Triticum aestivum]|uniref:F-box domain-containing protein n=6 Tax=Triticinae TaxID=1648030 RepID=A0A9R1I0K9_WHEAT|nr:uncharacterized protein LOC109763801 [Aegilops tauschii subsp. strangulata]XP_020178255.1 uncharacterized protein LOC109763801 [Aegilops tauschii subsp. strangulata]XP_044399420.1 uncharacterized protein LOC123123062 [Triticum aestivum]XP_044399421.1 uncharacterized protein LOC123123062 [Triticum aestivum]XP_044399422.1 uncharacterized protein LOC123123062 [Triticum aestivum]KAF7074991.1 hypothetical protein CFC21_079794 [Triticum aestivum]